ncbi:MAG: DoxX family protein [Chthoniobacteraceae bacterium]|nr:DoxX family protein [Chthoniobacteraceae bacterium]
MWSSLSNYRDGALLFLRVGLGTFYIWLHGWSRLVGGKAGAIATWKQAGRVMKDVGISFAPEAWGFMGAMASTLAVALVILGFWFRPACLYIFLVLIVMLSIGLETGSSLGKLSNAVQLAILVLSLLFIGPGKFSIDKG